MLSALVPCCSSSCFVSCKTTSVCFMPGVNLGGIIVAGQNYGVSGVSWAGSESSTPVGRSGGCTGANSVEREPGPVVVVGM